MEGLGSSLLSDQTTHHQPVRSVSLPSRIHPLSVKIQAALNRLSIWQRSSSSVSIEASFGSETLHVGLMNLTELYGCVHELLQSPHVQYTLLHHNKGKVLEDALDGSIVSLDTCEAMRNILSDMRECTQNLQSGLRRKGLHPCIEQDVNAYVNLRKKTKKEMMKHLTSLKKLETKDDSFNVITDGNYDVATTVNLLRETIRITVSIFRHTLLFISTGTSIKMKNSNGFRSIPRKIIPFVSSTSSEKALDLINNEVQSVDLLLGSFQDWRSRNRNNVEVEMVKNKLKKLQSGCNGLERGIDSVLKCLVQNRVLFLNIISRTV